MQREFFVGLPVFTAGAFGQVASKSASAAHDSTGSHVHHQASPTVYMATVSEQSPEKALTTVPSNMLLQQFYKLTARDTPSASSRRRRAPDDDDSGDDSDSDRRATGEARRKTAKLV